MTKLTVEQIKALYPDPVAPVYQCNDDGKYCVGSAFLIACNICISWPFPNACTIADGLQEYNSNLDEETAASFAESIVHLNDQGAFNEAWSVLEAALTDQGDA